MTSEVQTPPPPPTAPRFRWLKSILLGALLAIVLMGAAIWAFTGFGLLEIGKMMRGGKLRIEVDQPTVIRQIQALQRLESVSYSMDKIIVGERENPILPKFLAGDRLLLVVHGEVIAGVDLSKLQPNDVVVNERSVRIHVPRAEIFTTRLDNSKTRVYSRDTGIFSTPDPNLEGEVRQEAERQLQAAALQDGILKTADQNARQTITSLMTGLGFSHVETN
jgi:hypothetical protein